MSTEEQPVWKPVPGAWTCPPGYAHPKCRGCGHNYFGLKPQPLLPDGWPVDGGKCHWCYQDEEYENQQTLKRYGDGI